MAAEAQLQIFERLVMPGPLVSSHADLEDDCESCHVRFARQSQRSLCLDCHKEIAADIEAMSGFHGQSPDVGTNECKTCHTDHEGRGADILSLDRDRFDHDLTSFPLHDSHQDVLCADCHAAEATFHDADTECVSCHLDDDQHMGNLGESCSDCHRETKWADAFYDHEQSADYALTGAHATLHCVDCHIDEQYAETPKTCVGCHREDDSHMGLNGPDCDKCHTTRVWEETTFDHFSATSFALLGKHADLVCEDCHTGNKFEVETPTECVGCHLEDDAHDGINGTECADCHKESDWNDVTFDHAVDTDFPLVGAHAELECASCHVDPVAVSLPETSCIGCHRDDDPHEMQLGEDCASCHGERSWTEDVRFDHDLTRFPLLGSHAEVDCDDCHETHAYLDAPERCVDCHLDDDVHESRFADDCAFCHTPVSWKSWRFDHDTQTDFPLDGAHEGLECNGCHRDAVAELAAIQVSTSCASCHRKDDIHRGEFGSDCAQCHKTSSFDDLKELR